MKKKYLLLGLIFVLLIGVIGRGYFYFSTRNNDKTPHEITEPSKEVIKNDEDENDEKDKYKEIIQGYKNEFNNNDVVGEITIVNTDYKKAIMQASDNDYYLNHTEDNTSSYMGAIYLDFRVDIDSGRKLLIYGHNSANIDMPFKVLEKYYDYNYYKEHEYIKITTENKVRLYKIYAVYVEPTDFSYMQTDFNNDDEWYEHIKHFKDKSMYDTGVDISSNDNILILQTCSTHRDYRNYKRKFMLVIAKEVNE